MLNIIKRTLNTKLGTRRRDFSAAEGRKYNLNRLETELF
jgi:hypothetical protein